MKKNERLLQQLGDVNDKFIAEANPKPPKNRIKWALIGAMGTAAAGIIIWQGVKNIPDKKSEKSVSETKKYGEIIEFPENTGELEIIRTTDPGGGGMGFEGFMAYDVSTLLDGNPSRENCEFTELPVFIEPSNEIYSHGNLPVYTMDEMEERLKDVAGLLTDEEFTPVDRHPNGDYYKAKAGNIKLSMYSYSSRIYIEFENSVDLPPEYDICNTTDKDHAERSLEYLGEKYRDVIRMDNPTPTVFTDFDIYNEPLTTFALYDNSEDPLTALINYNLRKVYFYGGRKLSTISIYNNYDYKEFAGMYPVISYDEAYEKLISGDYYTTVWDEHYLPDGINTDEIFFTGISYNRTNDYKYTLPYYRFLIELHPERTGDMKLADGMREFGAYYVPAVSPDYLVIENMDVAFN
ncbi:MAG: hypothetical protein IKK47_00775 [Ruminococcus sp.]|nr:hypothetical protein [Ruminococcus sp.]